jgi:hypothetical protein
VHWNNPRKKYLSVSAFEEINTIQQISQSCAEFDFNRFDSSAQKVYTQGHIVWHPNVKLTFGKALSWYQGAI